MVIEVVVGDVREDAPGETQAPGALLHDGVGGDLHEAVVASRVGHAAQHFVQADGVGGRVGRFEGLVVDPIDDRGDQPGPVSEGPYQIVEQCHGGRFAVRARDADQLQLAARMTVESRRHVGHGRVGIFHDHIGRAFGEISREAFAHDDGGSGSRGRRDEVVAVACRAPDGEEAVAVARIAGVVRQPPHGSVVRPDAFEHRHADKKFAQFFHCSVSLICTVAPR